MPKFILPLLLIFPFLGVAQTQMPAILPLQQRAEVIDHLFEEKFETVLPKLMEEQNIDMWVIIAREYNEDPVVETMLPATWLAARRRTILVITHKPGEGIEGLAVARYDVGKIFKRAWNPEEEPDQWKRLAAIIKEKNPEKIALNTSVIYNHADGLTYTEHEAFANSLPGNLQKKIVSAENLAVRWLETRTDSELAVYEQICRIAHQIIQEGLSEKVIQPSATSTTDVQWWYREKILELKLDTWFHPTVDVVRADPGKSEISRSFSAKPDEEIIQPGDLIHIDFGITYLRLNTDMQELAYVLKPGETQAPAGLVKALATGNRLQDILTDCFHEGATGNEMLAMTRKNAAAENITPSIYSHPIGYHGHAAGPSIGMWDNQDGVPTGNFELHENTCYAIELNATTTVPEWNNKEIRVMLEETAVFKNGKVHYIDGRQKELYLIPRVNGTTKQ